jgi:hypothetical protein
MCEVNIMQLVLFIFSQNIVDNTIYFLTIYFGH